MRATGWCSSALAVRRGQGMAHLRDVMAERLNASDVPAVGSQPSSQQKLSQSTDGTGSQSPGGSRVALPAPDWLPQGFTAYRVTRAGGKSAGSSDTYYYSPAGHKLRSKREVVDYEDCRVNGVAYKLRPSPMKAKPPASPSPMKAQPPASPLPMEAHPPASLQQATAALSPAPSPLRANQPRLTSPKSSASRAQPAANKLPAAAKQSHSAPQRQMRLAAGTVQGKNVIVLDDSSDEETDRPASCSHADSTQPGPSSSQAAAPAVNADGKSQVPPQRKLQSFYASQPRPLLPKPPAAPRPAAQSQGELMHMLREKVGINLELQRRQQLLYEEQQRRQKEESARDALERQQQAESERQRRVYAERQKASQAQASERQQEHQLKLKQIEQERLRKTKEVDERHRQEQTKQERDRLQKLAEDREQQRQEQMNQEQQRLQKLAEDSERQRQEQVKQEQQRLQKLAEDRERQRQEQLERERERQKRQAEWIEQQRIRKEEQRIKQAHELQQGRMRTKTHVRQGPEDLELPGCDATPPSVTAVLPDMPADIAGVLLQVIQVCRRFQEALDMDSPPTLTTLQQAMLYPERPSSALVLQNLHAALLKPLLADERAECVRYSEIDDEDKEDYMVDAWCPLNLLTWSELARRYLLVKLNNEKEVYFYKLKCLSGDGGYISRSAEGRSRGVFASSMALAQAEHRLMQYMRPAHAAVADEELPAWASELRKVPAIPSNCADLIKQAVEATLAAEPPQHVRGTLRHAVMDSICRDCAATPSKHLALRVLDAARVVASQPEACAPSFRKRSADDAQPRDGNWFRLMHRCRCIVRELSKTSYGSKFCVVADSSPCDVTRPMDLQTVDARLLAGAYSSLEAFKDDVQLIWDNCRNVAHDWKEHGAACEKSEALFTKLFKEQVEPLLANSKPKQAAPAPIEDDVQLPDAYWEEEGCNICGWDDENTRMLVCDNKDCNKQYHAHCLRPPLSCIPEGQWLCPDCTGTPPLTEESSFGAAMVVGEEACQMRLQQALSLEGSEDCLRSEPARLRWLAVLLCHCDYAQLSLSQRLALTKWICDQAVGSEVVHLQIDDTAEAALKVEKELRDADVQHRRFLDDLAGRRPRPHPQKKTEAVSKAVPEPAKLNTSLPFEQRAAKRTAAEEDYRAKVSELRASLRATEVRQVHLGSDRWESQYWLLLGEDSQQLQLYVEQRDSKRSCNGAEPSVGCEGATLQPTQQALLSQIEAAAKLPGVWGQYCTKAQVDALLAWLNPRGRREGPLYEALLQMKDELKNTLPEDEDMEEDEPVVQKRPTRKRVNLAVDALSKVLKASSTHAKTALKSRGTPCTEVALPDEGDGSPCISKDLLVASLRADLLDIEAALPDTAYSEILGTAERRAAWRVMASEASKVQDLGSALLLLEQMILPERLHQRWHLWMNMEGLANVPTVAALALRLYSLDANLSYKQPKKKAPARPAPAKTNKRSAQKPPPTPEMDEAELYGLRRSKRQKRPVAYTDDLYRDME
eukprot:jgi/Chlat1/7291/Chrsp58S06879